MSNRSPRSAATIALILALATPLPGAEVASILVEPASISIVGLDRRQQVSVSIAGADGSTADATTKALYRVEPVEVADVSPSGLVIPRKTGLARLVVEVAGRSAEAAISVEALPEVAPVSYRRDVTAMLSKAGCNAGTCHGNINGKGGFRLSLRGDDPGFDFQALTRDTFGRRVDLARPAQSLILLKAAGQVPHEGGFRFAGGSPEASMLLRWISAGAFDDGQKASKLIKLDVFPPERILRAPGLRQQLVVTATFADGSRRDVTREASFDVNDPTRVVIGHDGLVEADRPFEAVVAVRYLEGRGVSRLAFLPDRPDFAWHDVPIANQLDAQVFAKLKAHKIQPSEVSNDAAFLRRATLDALGILPTPEEARAFLADPDLDKRGKLVDRLLLRPEFADFWALKWADVLRNEEKTMGAKGVWVFQRWLRDQVAADVPLDQFVRSLIASSGSNYANPPSSFYRTNRDASTATETVAQVFLGVRLQCARCHSHPFDTWTQDDYFGLAAYFGNVQRKQVNNVRLDNLDLHEINGDEVIYRRGKPTAIHPRSRQTLDPKPPHGRKAELPNEPNVDALTDLADWLTRDNPQFARNMANRVWFHLMGRGIVEPVDDFRDSNPPTNPGLLEALAVEFQAGGYRLKALVALIMKSRTYGLEARPNVTNLDDEINFSHAGVKLLPAEVLLDAICQVLEQPEDFDRAPKGVRSVQMPGARPGGAFLKVFGKPERLLTCECERAEATTLAQALQLINGAAIRGKLTAEDNRIGRLIRSGADDGLILDEVALAALGHELDATRKAAFLDFFAKHPDRRKALEDATWAILNSKEFLLRH